MASIAFSQFSWVPLVLGIAGAFVALPQLALGNSRLREVPISIESSDEGAHHGSSLLGMDVLKRFDTLLDFQANSVWWKPNAGFAAPFEKRYGINTKVVVFVVLAVSLVLAGAFVWRRRTRASGKP